MRRTIFGQVKVLFLLGCFFLCVCFVVEEASLAEPIAGETPKPEQTQQAPEGQRSSEMNDAVELFQKRDFEGARKLLQEAVKKNPDLPPADVIMAQLFSQVNMPGGVRSALERAAAEIPDDPEAFVIMGEIAMRERRITEATLLFEHAFRLMGAWQGSEKRRESLWPRLYGGLAGAAAARDKWDAAQKYLEAWLKLDPKSAPARQQLAQCLFQQKQPEAALAKLKEAAELEPEMLTPEAILAQFYARSGDQENARKWMVAALTAAPKDLKTRLVAAQWAWESGYLEEAEKQAAAAMQLDPKSLDALILRGIIALFRKDFKSAERYFESAHLQSPKNFAATNNLALALAEQEDESKRRRALDYAEANVRQYPKSSEALSTYGWVLFKLGRLEDAEKALRLAVSGGTFSADTAYYLARVLIERGRGADVRDARQLLESALASIGPFSQRQEAKTLLDQLKKP